MNDINELFFSLIRVAIDTQDTLPHVPSAEEWKQLYDMAKKQSLVGICFAALQKLSISPIKGDLEEASGEPSEEDLEPCEVMAKYWNMPEMLYLKWMGMAAKIQQKNELMNVRTKEALSFFREKGFPCQVLKGQGIAALYREASPQPSPEEGGSLKSLPLEGDLEEASSLALLRQSGDIDVWLAGGKEKAFELSKQVLGHVEGVTNYHIHFPIMDDAEIELHFKPSFLSSPIRNKRFLEFCKMHEPKNGCTDEPSLAFNQIYILLHCYRHLCGHGVGMRQVMDYYFVLREASLHLSPEGKRDSIKWIKNLGMARFAKAMAWVIGYVFDGDPDSPSFKKGLGEGAFEPDENDGRFLLNEIIHSGNMGHGEDRFDGRISPSAIARYWFNLKRDIRLLQICPHEALWDPVFNVYQFIWCKTQKYKI